MISAVIRASDTVASATPHASPGGKTASEQYLAALGSRSFLTLWSHANLFTDEGRRNGKGDGKELCDLLVVFGNHILIFSDKHCQFSEKVDLEVAWPRWYRRAIEKSARQLIGARNWLRAHPDRVFLDANCQTLFPYFLPTSENVKFHLLAVTRGSYKACREFFGGKSTGSLMINTGLTDDKRFGLPFSVGQVIEGEQFIHVLDELTLEVVLRELDTITDLVEYLHHKEKFLTKPGRIVMATGEEQLLAMYLTNLDESENHNFIEVADDVRLVHLDEGSWESLIKNPQYIGKKEADRDSYAWDALIEKFARCGEPDKGHLGPRLHTLEPALRVLAAESRLARRQLATILLDAVLREVPRGSRFLRVGRSRLNSDNLYVFLILPMPNRPVAYETYRHFRREFLYACCHVAKWKFGDVKRVIGIATEPASYQGSSEDLLLADYAEREWSKEDELEAVRLQSKLQILQDDRVERYERHDSEYPDIPSQ